MHPKEQQVIPDIGAVAPSHVPSDLCSSINSSLNEQIDKESLASCQLPAETCQEEGKTTNDSW